MNLYVGLESMGSGTVRLPQLGQYIDALAGVIGHQHRAQVFTGRHIAQRLGIDAAQWTRKRKGQSAIHPAELARLIDLFQLGPRLDYRLFHAANLDEFLHLLSQAQVGTYGETVTSKLVRLFWQQSMNSRLAISLEETTRKSHSSTKSGAHWRHIPHAVSFGSKISIDVSGPEKQKCYIFHTHFAAQGDVYFLGTDDPSLPNALYPDEGKVRLSSRIQGLAGLRHLFCLCLPEDDLLGEQTQKLDGPEDPSDRFWLERLYAHLTHHQGWDCARREFLLVG